MMYDAYDECWRTGNYPPSCPDCEFCPHKWECSGYEGDEE